MNNESKVEYKDYQSEGNTYSDENQKNSKSKVDLNNLIKRVKDEEKRSKRQNIVISATALSVLAVFGIMLTL
jgi:hypothetical protein